MDRPLSQETCYLHHKAVPRVEPLRSSEERQAEQVMEKDHQARMECPGSK